ncbi:MAG: GumC family protein, partial [Novosphingobium sp.]
MATSAPIDETQWRPHYAYDSDDDSSSIGSSRPAFDFRYIAAAIRSNLLLIIAIISVALAIAVISTMLETPRYTARTTIQISPGTSKVLGKEQEENNSPTDFDIDRNLKTDVEILKSRGLAQRVVQKLNLGVNPQFFASQEIEGIPPGTSPKVLADMAAGLVQGNLAVTLPRDSRIVTIAWNSTDPRMSALIANTYASEFIQADLQRKFDSSTYARGFVADQLAQTKARLEQSELALNAYSRGAGLIRTRDAIGSGKDGQSSGGGNSVTTGSLIQVNGAANEATARRIEAEGRWKAVSGAPLLASPTVLANGTVNMLMIEKAKVESQLQEERARHLDDYPTVRAKQQELAALNQQIQNAATNVRNGILSDYRAAVETERRLASQVTQLKSATLNEQDQTVQYALLAREADTNREVYDGLLQRFKELNASAGITLSNISIVDAAQVPGGPSSPNLFKNLIAALVIGIGLAAVTVFFKDQFDDSIRVPEDVESKLGMSLLGVVPRSHSEDPTEALLDPKSPISESYNSLRGSLLYSTAEGLPRVMLVTSAQSSEGKTTSSQAIAAGFARMGKQVLLIDADMRRPSIHRRVDVPNEAGLSTLLTSHAELTSIAVQ